MYVNMYLHVTILKSIIIHCLLYVILPNDNRNLMGRTPYCYNLLVWYVRTRERLVSQTECSCPHLNYACSLLVHICVIIRTVALMGGAGRGCLLLYFHGKRESPFQLALVTISVRTTHFVVREEGLHRILIVSTCNLPIFVQLLTGTIPR